MTYKPSGDAGRGRSPHPATSSSSCPSPRTRCCSRRTVRPGRPLDSQHESGSGARERDVHQPRLLPRGHQPSAAFARGLVEPRLRHGRGHRRGGACSPSRSHGRRTCGSGCAGAGATGKTVAARRPPPRPRRADAAGEAGAAAAWSRGARALVAGGARRRHASGARARGHRRQGHQLQERDRRHQRAAGPLDVRLLDLGRRIELVNRGPSTSSCSATPASSGCASAPRSVRERVLEQRLPGAPAAAVGRAGRRPTPRRRRARPAGAGRVTATRSSGATGARASRARRPTRCSARPDEGHPVVPRWTVELRRGDDPARDRGSHQLRAPARAPCRGRSSPSRSSSRRC